MAVVTPLNNPGGPEGDTVTVDEQLLNTEYCSPDDHSRCPSSPSTQRLTHASAKGAQRLMSKKSHTQTAADGRKKQNPGSVHTFSILLSGGFLGKYLSMGKLESLCYVNRSLRESLEKGRPLAWKASLETTILDERMLQLKRVFLGTVQRGSRDLASSLLSLAAERASELLLLVDSVKRSALHLAVLQNDDLLATCLLEAAPAGSVLRERLMLLQDSEGYSCLTVAVRQGNTRMATALIDAAGPAGSPSRQELLKLQDRQGWRCKWYAMARGDRDMQRLLREGGDEGPPLFKKVFSSVPSWRVYPHAAQTTDM